MPPTHAKPVSIYVAWVDVLDGPTMAHALRPDRRDLGGLPVNDLEWPGVSEAREGTRRLLCIGPTLTALFHPNRPHSDAPAFDHIYLLYRGGTRRESAEQLKQSIERISVARRWDDWSRRVSLVPINFDTEPPDDQHIRAALEKWVCGSWHDPLSLRYKRKRHLVVNCTTGAGSEGSWLQEFDWAGATEEGLGETTVERVAERKNLRQNGLVDEAATNLFEPVISFREKHGREPRKIRIADEKRAEGD